MSGDPPEFLPLNSVRSHEDDKLVNSILPSYHMFQATIRKKMVPQEENFKEDPPTYEMSPLHSAGITPVPSGLHSPQSSGTLNAFPFPIQEAEDDDETFNQRSADLWEQTVLANVHKLDLLSEKNPASKHLNVEVHITDAVCQKGVKPDIIDISDYEFKQGDFIHGYITIQNTSKEPIPFDMVYVVLEGELAVVQANRGPGDPFYQPTVFKFLNMLDLFALWSYANIDRLATDNGDPHDWCDGETDPYDNTVLSIDVKRLFQPGITYKRFFSFRLPDKLLDDNCEIHSLDVHCQPPPSVGNPVNLNFSARPRHDNADKRLKDFSLIDTFTSYKVAARVIGRASQYLSRINKDRYILAADVNLPFRVIPFSAKPDYREQWDQQVRAQYKAFVDVVEEKIHQGKRVLRSRDEANSGSLTSTSNSSSSSLPQNLTPISSALHSVRLGLDQEKLRQLYRVSESMTGKGSNIKMNEAPVYLHLSPFKKKSFTGSSKILGVLSLSSPKTEYAISYVPPPRYRNPMQHYETKVRIPLDLTYSCEKSMGPQTPPEPKKISCELVVLTARSKKHFIPIEFNHDMCFREQVIDELDAKAQSDDYENVDAIVIRPFNEYYNSIVKLIKKIGFESDEFRVETQLFKDIKSLAMLQTKIINLVVPDIAIASSTDKSRGVHELAASVPWVQTDSAHSQYNVYSKNIELQVDVNSCHMKGTTPPPPGKSAFDYICLVPDFQQCLMVRFYYFRISVKYGNGLVQLVNVPVAVNC